MLIILKHFGDLDFKCYIYIYIKREREREREAKKKIEDLGIYGFQFFFFWAFTLQCTKRVLKFSPKNLHPHSHHLDLPKQNTPGCEFFRENSITMLFFLIFLFFFFWLSRLHRLVIGFALLCCLSCLLYYGKNNNNSVKQLTFIHVFYMVPGTRG